MVFYIYFVSKSLYKKNFAFLHYLQWYDDISGKLSMTFLQNSSILDAKYSLGIIWILCEEFVFFPSKWFWRRQNNGSRMEQYRAYKMGGV